MFESQIFAKEIDDLLCESWIFILNWRFLAFEKKNLVFFMFFEKKNTKNKYVNRTIWLNGDKNTNVKFKTKKNHSNANLFSPTDLHFAVVPSMFTLIG